MVKKYFDSLLKLMDFRQCFFKALGSSVLGPESIQASILQ